MSARSKSMARRLEGRTILRVEMHPLADANGREAYLPVLFLDDGTAVRFTTPQLTEDEALYSSVGLVTLEIIPKR